MKRIVSILLVVFSFSPVISQQIKGTELGLEGYVGGSNLGGNFGFDVKYGLKLSENIVVGPSVRWMKSWSNSIGSNFSYSIYGGGAFIHARYGNMVFGGAEFEMLNTPFFYGSISATKSWVPTFFIGGGFSHDFNEIVRVNAGVFYDLVNSVNSPFRTSYLMKKTNAITGEVSGYIPVIYRISFFFPLGNEDDEDEDEDEEADEE